MQFDTVASFSCLLGFLTHARTSIDQTPIQLITQAPVSTDEGHGSEMRVPAETFGCLARLAFIYHSIHSDAHVLYLIGERSGLVCSSMGMN